MVQSLLTIATLPFIAQQPVAWFRHQGFECAPGTKILRLSGAVERPGFAELALPVSLAEVINLISGGFRHGSKPMAVQVGGTLGGIFPVSMLNLTLTYETIRELGGSLAMGGIEALDERNCLVSQVRDNPGPKAQASRLCFPPLKPPPHPLKLRGNRGPSPRFPKYILRGWGRGRISASLNS